LLPILAEFKIIKTVFGQLTLGIGTLDDIIEVLMLALVGVLPGFIHVLRADSLSSPVEVLLGLASILALTIVLLEVGSCVKRLLEKNRPPSFVFSVLTLLIRFSFIALGNHFSESLAAVGAIFGGVVLKGMLPKERLYETEQTVEFLGYVFLSPIFFAGVGAAVSIDSILYAPQIVIW